jgi:hypothetical protein
MKFIDNVGQWYRMHSIQAMAACAGVVATYETLPESLKKEVPSSYVHYFVLVMLALGFFGRLVQQPSLTKPETTPEVKK